MRKIHFNEETIAKIRSFIQEGHTMDQTCNRFNLKYDTLKRVMFENSILPYRIDKSHTRKVVDEDLIQLVCGLYGATKMRMQDIVKEAKLDNYVVQQIIDSNFSEEFQNHRKSTLYSISKLGDKNPMKSVTGADHPNWIGGVVSDGQGYLMVKKPEWYTGRKGSDYVFQHSVVMCEAIGLTEVPKGFVIHHIDGDKCNNNIDNLALVSVTGHGKIHSVYRRLCKVQRLSVQE